MNHLKLLTKNVGKLMFILSNFYLVLWNKKINYNLRKKKQIYDQLKIKEAILYKFASFLAQF